VSCFYCERHLSDLPLSGDLRHTNDHIYPRWLIRQLTKEQHSKLSAEFHSLNTVAACHGCNGMKGHLHPLDWLVIMPNNHRAKKLAERMIKMGEDMQEVFDALKRRKK
jgi:hypothetical protein